jgi:heavy metal sensor kinase
MGAATGDVVDTLSVFLNYLLVFAPVLFLIAASGGYWLSRRALSPVDELAHTARNITGTNLDRRLPPLNTGDELQRLTETLNSMLERIEVSFKRVTQFTGDASHELRTPVSLIRTEAELALRRSRGEDEYREALRHILLEAERTTGLIEQLLALARSDSGNQSLQMEQIDLHDTLAGVVEGWSRVATIRNLQLTADLGADLFVMGDRTALRRVADILLDNAFKYTPSPGSIALSLSRQQSDAVITVRDTGIGIAGEDQGKIFDRFFRVDKARNRDGGGAGLGLAIAQWIVNQHQGAIELESRPGEGAIFRVTLPVCPAPALPYVASQHS